AILGVVLVVADDDVVERAERLAEDQRAGQLAVEVGRLAQLVGRERDARAVQAADDAAVPGVLVLQLHAAPPATMRTADATDGWRTWMAASAERMRSKSCTVAVRTTWLKSAAVSSAC